MSFFTPLLYFFILLILFPFSTSQIQLLIKPCTLNDKSQTQWTINKDFQGMVSNANNGCVYNSGAGVQLSLQQCIQGNLQVTGYYVSNQQYMQVQWQQSALCWAIPSSSLIEADDYDNYNITITSLPLMFEPCNISPYGYAPNFYYNASSSSIQVNGTSRINNFCIGY